MKVLFVYYHHHEENKAPRLQGGASTKIRGDIKGEL